MKYAFTNLQTPHLVIFKCIDSHFLGPFISLGMDSGAIKHFDVIGGRVTDG